MHSHFNNTRLKALKPDLAQKVLHGEMSLDEAWKLNEAAIASMIAEWNKTPSSPCLHSWNSQRGRHARYAIKIAKQHGFDLKIQPDEVITNAYISADALPLVLKGYLPLPNYQSHDSDAPFYQSNQRDSLTYAREQLTTLFDEGILQPSWPDFKNTPYYFGHIVNLAYIDIVTIISAFRDRVITQESLAGLDESKIKFLLSAEGIEPIKSQWITLDGINNAADANVLLQTFLVNKYKDRIHELSRKGILPEAYDTKLHPKILVIFVGCKYYDGREDFVRKNLFHALESSLISLDDLINFADPEKLHTFLSYYKPKLMEGLEFTFHDAMKLDNDILRNVLLYLTEALLEKTITRSDIQKLADYMISQATKGRPQTAFFLSCEIDEADGRQALRDGSITIDQIIALPDHRHFSILVKGHSKGTSPLAKKIMSPEQAARLSDYNLIQIAQDPDKLEAYEMKNGFDELKKQLSEHLNCYFGSWIKFYGENAQRLQSNIKNAKTIDEVGRLIEDEITLCSSNITQSSPAFFAQYTGLKIVGAKWTYTASLVEIEQLFNAYVKSHADLVVLHEIRVSRHLKTSNLTF